MSGKHERHISYEGEVYLRGAPRGLMLQDTGAEGLAPLDLNEWMARWLDSRTGFIRCDDNRRPRSTVGQLGEREPTPTPNSVDETDEPA